MSNHVGLALKKDENGIPDLYLEGNELAMVSNAQAVGQHAGQRLMTFSGEWFLDTSAGVRWLSDVLGQSYDPTLAEALVKAELLDTHGVSSIESFSIGFDRQTRGIGASSISVMTEYDEEVTV